jgi:O-antigen ligase
MAKFQPSAKQRKLHAAEVTLGFFVCAHLVFLPWALGGMPLWSQFTSLALASVSLAIALFPRNYTDEHTGSPPFRLLPWPKLLMFPVFWLGLGLLGLVTTQALNPAWAYRTDGKSWWMVAVPHITWLPTSVRVPFARWGPWRMLMIYASAWLTVCAIWIGFTRRRTIQVLFTVFAINGIALAGLGISQRMLGNGLLFWMWPSPNASFFSSFVYKNHAGGYLNLALAVSCGLSAWYYVRGLRRLEKSNPSAVFVFFAICVAIAILISYARGATLVMLAFLSATILAFLIHQWKLPPQSRKPVIAVILVLTFGVFLKIGLTALDSNLAWDRLRRAFDRDDVSVHARKIADQASLEMLQDYWKAGSGSGSFQFLFPIYQQRFPEIARRQFWEHAHNDLLEIPIELGLPGMLLILGGFIYWSIILFRSRIWENPLGATVVLGCLFLIGMSAGEFVFQSPAILVTWCALWTCATMWAQMEKQRGRLNSLSPGGD